MATITVGKFYKPIEGKEGRCSSYGKHSGSYIKATHPQDKWEEYTNVYEIYNEDGKILARCGCFLPKDLVSYNPKSKKLVKKGQTIMASIKDLFKSNDQKLLEEYVYNGDGIDWTSEIVQKVFLVTHKQALVEAATEAKQKEKEEAKE